MSQIQSKIETCPTCPFRQTGTDPKASDCRSCFRAWGNRLSSEGLTLKAGEIPVSRLTGKGNRVTTVIR